MAITSVGTLGSASNKNSGTVLLTHTLPSDVPAGNLVVVWIAWDSVFSVITPDTFPRAYKTTDSSGNIYTTLAAETDVQGFFATGAFCGIALSQLRSPLSAGDTITVEGQHVGQLIAKSMSVWEFELGSGMRWSRCGPFPSQSRVVGADPSDITIDCGFTQDWLFLHGLGSEGPNTDTYTWDPDYTQVDAAGTTGGADDSNIHVRGGWRIDNLSGDTVQITSDTADRDNAQVLVAICEVPARPFPISPILDDFNRANENPLDNGTWNPTDSALIGPKLEIVSNEVRGITTGDGGSFWETVYSQCEEVYATATDFVGRIYVYMNSGGDAGAVTMTGYAAGWFADDGNSVGGMWASVGRAGNSGRVDSDSRAPVIWIDSADGYKIGLQRSYSALSATYVHHFWADTGSGWEEHAAHLMREFPGIDFQFGFLALGLENGTLADDFGGGQVPCSDVTQNVQIMRYA